MKILIFLADIFYGFKAKLFSLKNNQSISNILLSKQKGNPSLELVAFKNHLLNLEPKTILLVELNTFHIETLEVVADYFNQLGCKVDILVRKEISTKLESFKMDIEGIICALNSKEICKYSLIFFNTMVFGSNPVISIHSFLKIPTKISGLYHTISDIKRFKDYENTYFALRNMSYKNITLKGLNLAPQIKDEPMLNPKIITFISIGFSIYHRGFKENLKSIIKILRAKKIYNVRFILVGREAFDASNIDFLNKEIYEDKYQDLPPSNMETSYILMYQNPSVEILHSLILRSHFILGLYDRFAHRHYLKFCTSGQRQLSLGYNVPLVINEPFCSSFNFTNKQSLIFRNPKSILEAINLANTPAYFELKENLSILNHSLRKDSIRILREFLSKEIK